MGRTFNSSRNLAFGFSSRSMGPLRWLRTKRRCFASTKFSRNISGSKIGCDALSGTSYSYRVKESNVANKEDQPHHERWLENQNAPIQCTSTNVQSSQRASNYQVLIVVESSFDYLSKFIDALKCDLVQPRYLDHITALVLFQELFFNKKFEAIKAFWKIIKVKIEKKTIQNPFQ